MKYILFFLIFLVSAGYSELADHLKPLDDDTHVCSLPNVDCVYLINLDHRKEKYQESLEELAPYGIVPCRFSAVNGWALSLETIWDVGLVFEKGMLVKGMGTVYVSDNGKEYASSEIVEEIGKQYYCHCMPRGGIGCLLSHLSIMNEALKSDYEVVWICEDDIEVTRDPRVLSQYIDDLDRIVGRDNWDVFFTFRDYLGNDGQYYTPYGANYRPNIDTSNQESFNIDLPISSELRQVGSRFGTQSMIWTKKGMKKALKFYETHKLFMPFDLDLVLIPDIKMYSVMEDVVSNKLYSISDLGSSDLQKK